MSTTQSFTKTTQQVTREHIWSLWSNLDRRHEWDEDTEWMKLNGEFKAGNTADFVIKGDKKIRTMDITEVTDNQSFTDTFKLPLAKMHGIHTLRDTNDGLEITTTMKMEGPLGFLWNWILMKDIVKTLPEQTDKLIEVAQK